MMLVIALDKTKHRAEYLAVLSQAKKAFPDRQEWLMADALLCLEAKDFDGALEKADRLDGPLKPTGDMIRKAVATMRGMKNVFDMLRGDKK